MRHTEDEAGIIISWLAKIVVLLAILGVVGYDVGSILINDITLDSSATDVAIDVSITVDAANIANYPDSQVYDLAVGLVEDDVNGIEGAKVLRRGTEVDEDGVVHIRLRRKTDTLVTELIGPLKRYTVATADGQAGTN